MEKLLTLLVSVLLVSLVGGQWQNDLNQVCRADIAFVLDGSGSVGLDNWQLVLDFVNSLASEFGYGAAENRIGVVDFGNDASVQISLNQYGSLVSFEDAVNNIPYRDENTNTAAGIRITRTQLFGMENDRDDVPNIMIIVTDGVPTREVEQTQPEADLAREEGIDLFTIGIGTTIDESLLLALVNDQQDHTFQVDDFDGLMATLTEIVLATCVVIEPTTLPPISYCNEMDLILVLDASGSIGETNFTRVKTFAQDILDEITVGISNTRVATVSFSSEAYLQFNLDTYSTKAEIQTAIGLIPWRDERTHTSAALRMVRELVLDSSANDPDRPNMVVIITDAFSNVDELNTLNEARHIHNYADTVIVSVGVGDAVRMDELRAIANDPCDHYLRLFTDYVNFLAQVPAFMNDLCSVYPVPVPTIDVTSYHSDVIFMLASVDNNQDDWQAMTNWLASQFLDFQNEVSNYRFGVVMATGDGVSQAIGLEQYNDGPADVTTTASLVANLAMPTATNALANALQYTSTLFTGSSDRAGVPNKIVIVTGPVPASEANALREQAAQVITTGCSVFLVCPGHADGVLYGTWFMDYIGSLAYEEHNFPIDTIEDLADFDIMTPLAFDSVPYEWGCDFEVTLTDGTIQSTMCDIDQSTTDIFDWTLHTGTTPSRNTGPLEGAASGLYYVYIEASDQEKNDHADMISPVLTLPSGYYCFGFAYNMHGFHVNSLDVVRLRNYNERLMWHVHGQQGDWWHYAALTVHLQPGDRLIVRASRGDEYSGDIAVDGEFIKTSPCVVQLPSV